MSSCIEWKNKFSVGVKRIDDEHKVLVGLINKAFDSSELMDATEATFSLLRDMNDYAEMHFATEDTLMREYNYPTMDLHLKEHDLFRRRVSEALARGKNGADPYKVFQFLRDWFYNHTMKDDMALGEYLQSKRLS
ncbi:bacteriohemerythrin [Pseudodesulfovibrio sp. zrk46]|uniref:bacteriohemerythrin n=1 Tax=Pseudodesulfovibrio sp. zrk46 TaxID=2725288 RepID=UPI00144A216D|nr:bacteriohemerythrin [Pseudodesulfovibrio sp. zrk46]QJB56712.1 hemerythrin family protein [Pseudodesulfovibrio sp. zrk46]